MANNLNLSPEHKAQLRKEVMDEINKTTDLKKSPAEKPRNLMAPRLRPLKVSASSKITPYPKPLTPVKINLTPKISPVIKTLPIIKTPAPIVSAKKSGGPKPAVIKKIVKKSVRKPVKRAAWPPKSAAQPPLKPLVKLIAKPKEKLRSGSSTGSIKKETFFWPDSFVGQPTKKKNRFKSPSGDKKIFTGGFLIFICLTLVFVLILAVDIFGIYRLNWDNQANRVLVNVFSLPAGQVNGRLIKLSDYLNDLKIIEATLASQTDAPAVDERVLKDQLFNRLVSLNIIDNELKKYNLSVTGELLDEEMQKTISQIGSKEKATEEIKKVYGLDLAMFKDKVLKPIMALNLLQQAIIQDNNLPLNKQASGQADEALRLALTPGTDFETLVLQYSNDLNTVNKKGDLGWFKKGELSQEAEDALFALESGGVYSQVFKNDFGYHIFKVDSKLIDEASGEESLKLREILVKVDVELYVKSLFDQAIIKKYVK